VTATKPQQQDAVPPGYKQTEGGVIPEDWDVHGFGQMGHTRTGPFGTLLKAEEYYAEEGVPLVSVRDIREGVLRFDNHTPLVPPSVVRRLPEYVLEPGDIVFGRKGSVERSALVASDQGGCFLGSDGIRVRLPACYHAPFLVWLLQSKETQSWLLKNATGTTMASMNQSILGRLRLALPPTLAEQEAIAGALSDADAWIESLEKLIAKRRAIKQGTMQALLTPPDRPGHQRLPEFTGEWDVKRIGEIATPSTRKNACGGDLPVLTCSKHLGFVDSLSYFKSQVFSHDTTGYKVIVRGEIGYPANHVEEGSIGLQDLYDAALVSPIYVVFSVDPDVNPYFLHRLLKLDRYRHVFASATSSSVDRRGSLRWPAFSQIEVAIPELPEQEAIAAVIADMDTEIEALVAKLAKARHIKQGMMQELLTGRIRLVQPMSVTSGKIVAKTDTGHNWAINEAVVIAVLTHRFGSEQFPLGRKRYTKLSYLLHRHKEHQAVGYRKKAAGPYNPDTKYKGPENIAVKNGYVLRHKRGVYSGFVAAEQVAKAEDYFEKWYGVESLTWLEQFRWEKNDELELLTTVDMAMEDLYVAGKDVGVGAVKGVIAGHPEWKAKLDRPVFSDFSIARAIKRSQELFDERE